ncbi:MAG TPA: hypothetical protein PLD10_17885, partial [Rhodopila sp.]|nr:hypothetical protein [Rhodopila sp.]
VLKAYQAAKDVTLQRMYLDTMQDVLSHSQSLIIDDKLKGLVPYLPLNLPPPQKPAAPASSSPPVSGSAPATGSAPGSDAASASGSAPASVAAPSPNENAGFPQ